jgi:hypothetical protein
MPKNKEEQSAYQPSILDWHENKDPEKKEALYSFSEGTHVARWP